MYLPIPYILYGIFFCQFILFPVIIPFSLQDIFCDTAALDVYIERKIED